MPKLPLKLDLTAHVRGQFAEALVFAAIGSRHPDAEHHRPRNAAVDVSTAQAGLRIDAKTAQRWDYDGVPSVGWHVGNAGTPIVKGDATHIGLVLFADDNSFVVRRAISKRSGQWSVDGRARVSGDIWLVPAGVARDAVLHGRYGYLSLKKIDRYRLQP